MSAIRKHTFLMRYGDPDERVHHYNMALRHIWNGPTEDLRASRAYLIDSDPDIRDLNQQLHNEIQRRDRGENL